MSIIYRDIISTTIKKGNRPLSLIKFKQGASEKQCKAIFRVVNGVKTYCYDNARYRFGYDTEPTYNVEACGGNITISNPTSQVAHGDDLSSWSSVGWGIDTPSGTMTQSYGSRPQAQQDITNTYTLTQNTSGLTARAVIIQKADRVVSRTLRILSFSYPDIDIQGNSVSPSLTIRMTENWMSNTTTNTDYVFGQDTLPSAMTVLFNGGNLQIGVNGTTGVISGASALHDESTRTLLLNNISVGITYDTATVSQSNVPVYQQANDIVGITAYIDPITDVANTGGKVRLYSNGILRSGDAINGITNRCAWNSSDTTITTESGVKYANIPENTTSARKEYHIEASYNSTYYSSRSIYQSASSSWKYLLVTLEDPSVIPSGQTDFYMRTRTGSVYCRGTLQSNGKIKFTANNLEAWGGLQRGYSAILQFYSSQSDAGYLNHRYTMGISVVNEIIDHSGSGDYVSITARRM